MPLLLMIENAVKKLKIWNVSEQSKLGVFLTHLLLSVYCVGTEELELFWELITWTQYRSYVRYLSRNHQIFFHIVFHHYLKVQAESIPWAAYNLFTINSFSPSGKKEAFIAFTLHFTSWVSPRPQDCTSSYSC